MQATAADRFRSHVEIGIECWMWTRKPTPDGYGTIQIDSKSVQVHRFSLEQAMGKPIPAGFYALHTCDTRLCVRNDDAGVYVVNGVEFPRWGHLWLGTHADNMADAAAKGRLKGKGAGRSRLDVARLTPEAVQALRAEYATGCVTERDLAAKFSAAQQTIHAVLSGRTWKWLLTLHA